MNMNIEGELASKKQEKKLAEQVEERRNSLSTDRLDMSYGEILGMYDRDELIIDPEFQRLFRWERHQMSRFVESVLLGIPTPPIFVAENEEGQWELVDGLQRTSTLISFFGSLKNDEKCKNGWSLDSGELVPELENFNHLTLPKKFLLNIKRSSCRIEILRWNSNYDMRYELFNRLNTGGSPLTDQEIRNCIFRGVDSSFNDLLKELSEDKNLLSLVSPTSKQEDTLYLQELVLRFMSLYEANGEFKGAFIKQHMTSYMKKAVSDGFDKNVCKLLTEVLENLSSLGAQIFRFSNGCFSTSLFDAITVGMAKNIESVRLLDTKDIKYKINSLKEDKEFRTLTGSAASGRIRVVKRVEKGILHFAS